MVNGGRAGLTRLRKEFPGGESLTGDWQGGGLGLGGRRDGGREGEAANRWGTWLVCPVPVRYAWARGREGWEVGEVWLVLVLVLGSARAGGRCRRGGWWTGGRREVFWGGMVGQTLVVFVFESSSCAAGWSVPSSVDRWRLRSSDISALAPS